MSVRHILVVDDDDAVREIVRSCFEDVAGWLVAAADSGREGLKLVQSYNFDAIVLDMMMPEMDGVAFLRHLREIPEMQFVPVILLTAKVDAAGAETLRMLNVEKIIAKPFDPILLVEQVDQFLG